jgi:hypothetical protein
MEKEGNINTNAEQTDKSIPLVVFVLAHSDVQSIVTMEGKEKGVHQD